jgi:hypothetical protein
MFYQAALGIAMVAVLVLAYRLYALRRRVGEVPNAFYFETAKWEDGSAGMMYARDDEEMDSAVYLPEQDVILWFQSRRRAMVDPEGDFELSWPNGGRVTGNVTTKTKTLTLNGVAGTPEDGVHEVMIRA